MRILALALALFVLSARPARAGDELLDQLLADSEKKSAVTSALKLLDTYFKADAEIHKPGRRTKRDDAMSDFLAFLETSEASVGVDLRSKYQTVLAMLDKARSRYLFTRFKKGQIQYFKIDDARGMDRFEYSLLVPRPYKPTKTGPIPLVVSLHGRVIDPRHPAFRRADFNERSRQAIWNHWLKTPGAEEAIVMAPTSGPKGIQFRGDNAWRDVQRMFRTLREAMTKYRVDWNRVFLEVQGEGIQVLCQYTFMFAGAIVRDRVDNRNSPILAKDRWFMLENLNGLPLCYVADEANWDKVGKPLSEALTAAYQKSGHPENLIVMKAKRDANNALKGDPDKIAAFLRKHRRLERRAKWSWRFFEDTMASPSTFELNANYEYDVDKASRDQPLANKAGRLQVEIEQTTLKDAEGNEIPHTILKIDATEVYGIKINLADSLFDLDHPVSIVVNGKTVKDKVRFKRDWKLFLTRIIETRYFMLPYVGVVDLERLDYKPQFEAPVEEKKEGATGASGDGSQGADTSEATKK